MVQYEIYIHNYKQQEAHMQTNELLSKIEENIAKVMIGKREVTRLLLASLAAGGHVLLEDVPGTGKTVLAKSLAKSMGCEFERVQFTPDLLPSDVTGLSFFNQEKGELPLKKALYLRMSFWRMKSTGQRRVRSQAC